MVVARVQNGDSEASVSRDNAMPQSNIRGWLKDEQKVRDSVDTVDSADFFMSMLLD